jgi:hypothetical protein
MHKFLHRRLVIGNPVIGNLPALPVLLLIFLILQSKSLFPADQLRIGLRHFFTLRMTAPQKRQAKNSNKKQRVSHRLKTVFISNYYLGTKSETRAKKCEKRKCTNVDLVFRPPFAFRTFSYLISFFVPCMWNARAASIF